MKANDGGVAAVRFIGTVRDHGVDLLDCSDLAGKFWQNGVCAIGAGPALSARGPISIFCYRGSAL